MSGPSMGCRRRRSRRCAGAGRCQPAIGRVQARSRDPPIPFTHLHIHPSTSHTPACHPPQPPHPPTHLPTYQLDQPHPANPDDDEELLSEDEEIGEQRAAAQNRRTAAAKQRTAASYDDDEELESGDSEEDDSEGGEEAAAETAEQVTQLPGTRVRARVRVKALDCPTFSSSHTLLLVYATL